MQQEQTTIFRRLGMMMRQSYNEIAQEALPERWMDLIKYLNEKERTEQSGAPPGSTKH